MSHCFKNYKSKVNHVICKNDKHDNSYTRALRRGSSEIVNFLKESTRFFLSILCNSRKKTWLPDLPFDILKTFIWAVTSYFISLFFLKFNLYPHNKVSLYNRYKTCHSEHVAWKKARGYQFYYIFKHLKRNYMFANYTSIPPYHTTK